MISGKRLPCLLLLACYSMIAPSPVSNVAAQETTTVSSPEPTTEALPVFPTLEAALDEVQSRSARLISKVVFHSPQIRYETFEEVVDFDSKKQALFRKSNSQNAPNQVSSYLSTQGNYIYEFAPFTCATITDKNFKDKHGDAMTFNEEGDFNLLGALAIWSLAAREINKLHYEGNRRWLLKTEESIIVYSLPPEGELSPKKFTFEVKSANDSLLKTISFTSFTPRLDKLSNEYMLNLPIGYNCVEKNFETLKLKDVDTLIGQNSRISLDMSATISSKQNDLKRDSMSVVVLRRHSSNNIKKFDETEENLFSIQVKSTLKDDRTIYERDLGLEFKIDNLNGRCKIVRKDKSLLDDDSTIGFQSGSLQIKSAQFQAIFNQNDGFKLVRYIKDDKSTISFWEKSSSFENGDGKTLNVQIVKAFTEIDIIRAYRDLDYVLVMVFSDSERTKLIEFYKLKVTGFWILKSPALAFDMSDECFLNVDSMRANRNYAWLDLIYDLPSSGEAHLLESSIGSFKRKIQSDKSYVNFFNAPVVEESLTDEKLTLRYLLLDLPAIYKFKLKSKETLVSSDSKLYKMLQLVATDDNHCADFCRIHKCSALTFCEKDKQCKLAISSSSANASFEYVSSDSCNSYVDGNTWSLFGDSVFGMNEYISLLKWLIESKDESGQPLLKPKEPRLLQPPIANLITKLEQTKLLNEFINELKAKLPYDDAKLNILRQLLILTPAGVIYPTRLRVEHSEDSSVSRDNNKEPIFEVGISGYKYQPLNDASQKAIFINHKLSYEQCELACVDINCASFSYCESNQECILSNRYDVSEIVAKVSIENESVIKAPSCFIMQRDFTDQFDVFFNMVRPHISMKQTQQPVGNAQECAYACIAEKGFNCRSFDLCPVGQDQVGFDCLLQESKSAFAQPNSESGERESKNARPDQGCDHFARAYLADFYRLPDKILNTNVDSLKSLNIKEFKDLTVQDCAEKCAVESSDCTAFDFCFKLGDSSESTADSDFEQDCRLFAGSLKNPGHVAITKIDDLNQTINSTTPLSDFLLHNNKCSFFVMRQDADEARWRPRFIDDGSEPASNESSVLIRKQKLTIWGATMLVIFVAVASIVVGSLFVVMRRKSRVFDNIVNRTNDVFEDGVTFVKSRLTSTPA